MVTKFLLTLTQDNHLIWRKARSPFIVGMFHDLCKIDQYRHPVAGHIEEFNGGRTPIYNERAWEYNFTDKSEWNDYTRAVSQYPNVLWTHQADMLASHVAGV